MSRIYEFLRRQVEKSQPIVTIIPQNYPTPYGFCPVCKMPGVSRERRPYGNDRCINKHCYPSRDALQNAVGLQQKE